MNKARAFFFVCAGLFLLALTYHLGARNAGAQAGGPVVAAGTSIGWNAVVGRTVYTKAFGIGNLPIARPPVPGTEAVVAVEGNHSGNMVLLANGDAYLTNASFAWVYDGNVFSGLTPTENGTWGAMKARYRGERGAAQPAPQAR